MEKRLEGERALHQLGSRLSGKRTMWSMKEKSRAGIGADRKHPFARQDRELRRCRNICSERKFKRIGEIGVFEKKKAAVIVA